MTGQIGHLGQSGRAVCRRFRSDLGINPGPLIRSVWTIAGFQSTLLTIAHTGAYGFNELTLWDSPRSTTSPPSKGLTSTSWRRSSICMTYRPWLQPRRVGTRGSSPTSSAQSRLPPIDSGRTARRFGGDNLEMTSCGSTERKRHASTRWVPFRRRTLMNCSIGWCCHEADAISGRSILTISLRQGAKLSRPSAQFYGLSAGRH